MTDIQKPTTTNAEYIIGNNWPEESESSFLALSAKESASSASATQSSTTAHEGAAVVNAGMTGKTADAGTEAYQKHGANLENRSTNHGNKATIAAIHAQTITNSKGQIVNIVTTFEAYAKTISENPLIATQPHAKEEFDKKRDEAKNEVAAVYNGYETAKNESLSQFQNGSDPSVPASAPSEVPDGAVDQDGNPIAKTDTSSLDPSVTSALSQLSGTATQAASGLTSGQGAQSTLSQALQQSPELIKALKGEDGVPMSQDAFDKLMDGQGGPDSKDSSPDGPGDAPKGGEEKTPDGSPPPKDGPPPDKDGPPPGSTPPKDGPTLGDKGNVEGVSNVTKPSPAETPQSAPPPSAGVPSTNLTSDDSTPHKTDNGSPSGTSPSGTSPSGTAPSGNAPSNNVTAPRHEATTVSNSAPSTHDAPSNTNTGGTNLSSDTSTSTSPTAPSQAPLTNLATAGAGTATMAATGAAPSAAAFASAPVTGAPIGGSPIGGTPMGGMSATPTAPPPAAVAATPLAPAPAPQPASPTTPLSGNVPNANAAVAQMSPAQPATVTAQGQGHAASAPVIAGIPPMAAAAIIGAPVGTLHHAAERFTPNERVAGTYLNGVFKGYSIAKDPGNIAVALLPNGTAVYNTVHGCGYLPRGAVIPANVKPLLEIQDVASLFVSDWTGCDRPGYVLRLATQLGMIPEPLAIVAVGDKDEEGVTMLSLDQLRGTPIPERTVSRGDFGGVAESDMGEVFTILDNEWGNHVTYAKARTDLILTEWDVHEPVGDAVSALARYILADAHESMQRGDIAGAQYALLRVLRLPRPEEL